MVSVALKAVTVNTQVAMEASAQTTLQFATLLGLHRLTGVTICSATTTISAKVEFATTAHAVIQATFAVAGSGQMM